MTGQELFHALSFVDERYIAEAETVNLGARIPWVKILSVAACLCILLTGYFAVERFGMLEKAPEAAPEAAAEPEKKTFEGTYVARFIEEKAKQINPKSYA